MPVHTYTNWNKRKTDEEEKVEPFRKYCFICEGANTETFYFKKLIDLRKELNIHPLIDIRLWEKTDKDKDISFAKNLFEFALQQKALPENDFDLETDKMIVVFDADIFECKVDGYEDLVSKIEEHDIAAVSNPGFELFLLLHIKDSYCQYILGHEKEFLEPDQNGSYKKAFDVLRDATNMNAKTNHRIGLLAENVKVAIEQEKQINQNIHQCKGRVTSNIGLIIEHIMNEAPNK
ncbi:MAG: RloB domain-containing protein [Succinivibrio sp.]|nr:RloB domain-containing protein [Succinivibrio sp.]